VDVSELVRCLNIVANLQELHICRTKFKERTFLGLSCALSICKNLTSLILTDNSLTGQEINALINAVEMMKNLKILNLSKCNLTETQAKAILHKHEQAENIVSLDLSHNTLQGNEIVIAICQLHSLEELDLSHNCVRFSPLPNWKGKRNHFSTRMKEISLFSNHMKPDDISNFCSLVKSELLKINLGFNHVGGSIWSLCSLGERIEHLKVLSLGSTDICDNVDGLVFLLSLVRELEDLNLSSNNLSPDHFQQLQKPLSKFNQLKTLNLSANYIRPDGMKAIADIFKEFPLLERLDMSSSYIREAEVSVLCKSLVSARKLKYLDLSGNYIDIELMDDVLVLPPTLEELLFSDITNGQKLFAQIRCLENLRKLHLNKLMSRECDVNALAEMLHYLVKLEELSLAYLVGPKYHTVLLEIKSLGNLKKIDLSGMIMIDVNEIALFEMLSSLLSLEELILTDMCAENCEKMFIAIKLLKRLRKLSLGGEEVTKGVQAFLDMLSSLSILEVVVFPCFDLGNSDFDPFKSLRCLRILDLCNTNIDDSNGEALARVLPTLHLLEKLALEFEYSKYESPLFAAFGKLKYLKALSLIIWGGKIDIDALVEVLASLHLLEKFELLFPARGEQHEKLQCDALGNLRYLRELSVISLSGNVDIEALARALSSLQLLEKLELYGENFQYHEFAEQLYAAIGKLKHLRKLDLFVTNGEALAKVLPLLELLEELMLCWRHVGVFNSEHENQVIAAIGKLRYLKELDLECSIHTNTCIETLSKTLRSLRLLEKLKLEGLNDNLKRRESKEFFIALRQLKRLKELHLEICKGITRTDIEGLATAFMTCEMLEKVKLDASSCLNESQCKRLLIAVAKLKNLKALSLELGKITRDNVDVLVEVLTSLQVLENLTLFVHSCSIHDCGEDCDEDCDEGCDSNNDGECEHDTYNNSCSKCRHEKNERRLIETKVLTAVKKLKHFKKFEIDKYADFS
jgi:Ran GTPase-activating protein (RanGAP) involved in mRNA processing and transport